MAARYVEQTRPVWSWIASEWRRVATVAVLLLTLGVVLHTMFGANGMVVYQQKRAERQTLQSEVMRLQKENDQYVERIKALKTDHRAIEKEAREQLHYTRPGEYVYVAPDQPSKPAVGRAKNDK
jgi:cell division protein FtsB